MSGANALLSTPWIAGVLGFLIGFGLIAAVALSRAFVRSKDSRMQTAVMGLAMGLSMFVVMGALIAFVLLVPETFLWFGLGVGAGFVIGLAIMSVWLYRAVQREEQGS